MEEQQTEKEEQINEQEATTIGMFLKFTRLKQKKSIESASETLCIRKIYIKALEEDDYETLPPIPYGVGFVRSYATYLGLNAQRIAQIYKQQAFPQKEKNTQTVVTRHTELTIPKKKQIYIGLIAIVLLYALWLSSRSLTKKEDLTETQTIAPVEVVEVVDVVEEPLKEVVKTKDEAKEKTKIPEAQEAEKSAEQVVVSEASYPEKEEPAASPKTTITLKLKGQSWIELKDGQKVYVSGVKNRGFVFTTDYTDGMILSIGKYYNVDVYINGVLTRVASPKKQTNIRLDQFIKH